MEYSNRASWQISDFRDITEQARKGQLEEIMKYDILRDVVVYDEREERHGNILEKVYYFRGYDLRGRIFPLDEIINIGERCDLITHGWKSNPFTLETQLYHDFYNGEELIVKVSRKSPGFDPSFKLFNYITGFIKNAGDGLYEKINPGTEVLVRTYCLKRTNKGYCIEVMPLEILT